MSREENLIRERDWYDGAYSQGVSPYDNPYLYARDSQEWNRELAQARMLDERERTEAFAEQYRIEQEKMFKNMTPEERREYEEQRANEEQRRKYYAQMDPELRIKAYERENQILKSQEEEKNKRNNQQRETAEKERAIKFAKMRYRQLSAFSRLFAKNPQKINFNDMTVDQIKDLYGGKGR